MTHAAESAAVLAVGDELVQGDRQELNVAWLAQALAVRDWSVTEARLLGDEEEELARAMTELALHVGLIVATGGLGPTLDDVTRHAAARAAGVELRVDQDARAELEAWFRGRGRPMAASNERQMLLPAGAVLLRNIAGTAPGFRMRLGGAWLAVLPGPPHEMRTVFETELAPWLATLPPRGAVRRRAELQLFGLPESEFADRVGTWMERDANPCIGVLAHSGILSVKVVARGASDASARAVLAPRLDELRREFGPWLFAEGPDDLARVVGRRLIDSGTTLATAESCTGGLVAGRLTEVPGISAVFLEGFVTYSDRSKVERLGVPQELLARHGAVSAEVATAMARGAAERSGAQLAIAVTGVAGPGGGTSEKPVGLVHFGLAHDGEVLTHEARFPARGRQLVREWATNTALELVRRALLKER